jgi:cytochrome b subunit of formate dehydrogenase
MTENSPSPDIYPAMTLGQTWTKALTQPNQGAYREIVHDPGASLGKAVLWLASTAFFGSLLSGIATWLFSSSYQDQISRYFNLDFALRSFGIVNVVVTTIFYFLAAIIGTFIIIGIVQLIAKMLGGTGSFEQLIYAVAAYQSPLQLGILVLGSIPYISCLVPFLVIYTFILNVIANKAVHQYDTGKAIISSLAPWLLVFLFCCCFFVIVAITGSAILGPSVQNVFDSIQSSLMP